MKKGSIITAFLAIFMMVVPSKMSMTIGWDGIGTLWGRTALTVYVAEKRYTKEFMDKADMYANFPAGIHSM